jgi:CrcB protein
MISGFTFPKYRTFLLIQHLPFNTPVIASILKHPYLMAGLGGAIGSIGRVMMSNMSARWLGEEFPFGTVIVNVSGAVLMGLLAGYGESEPGKLLFAPAARTFLMIGVLGGYTTFSSFSLQTFLLLEQGNLSGAFLNVILSVCLCVLGIWLGFLTVRAF